MVKLGVNIDHVATLRQARREFDPDPVEAALIAQKAGADSIVAHLREDRRHIQDADIRRLKKALEIPLNFEMSLAPEIVNLAARIKPFESTIVPEKRQEVTTEGGLDVIKSSRRVSKAFKQLSQRGIFVSLFIDPTKKQIDATHDLGVNIIELHTGDYDHAKAQTQIDRQYKKLVDMTAYAKSLGMTVNAGHGLKYHNVKPIAKIKGMNELNIGHSIITRSIFVGLEQAVKEMLVLVKGRRRVKK